MYNLLGRVTLCGDFNSSTGVKPDYISDISLSRYVDQSDRVSDLPERKSCVVKTNLFGNKLIGLCKSSSLYIPNGAFHDHKDIGKCTGCVIKEVQV